MCVYRVNQHSIVPNFYSVSINKILVAEFVTMKISQSLNLMSNMSTLKSTTYQVCVCESNQMFRTKTFLNNSSAKDQQVQRKLTDYEIFELKYANTNRTR